MSMMKHAALTVAAIAICHMASAAYRIEGGRIVLDSPFALEIGSTEYCAAFGNLVRTHAHANYDPLTKNTTTNIYHHAIAHLSEPYFGCGKLSLTFDGPEKSLKHCFCHFPIAGIGSPSAKRMDHAECRKKIDEIVDDMQKRLGIVMRCTRDDTGDAAQQRMKRLLETQNVRHRKSLGFAVTVLCFLGERIEKSQIVDYQVSGSLFDSGYYAITISYSRHIDPRPPSWKPGDVVPVYTNAYISGNTVNENTKRRIYPYTDYILDEKAEFYNPNQKVADLKKHPVCNSPIMAAQIAEAVFVNTYGEKVLKERPWHVTDMGNSYVVTGSLEKGSLGGVAQLKIMKENCAVVLHLHGK